MKNKIKCVSARNFKGQTFKQPLSAVTVIAGQNAKGKSSRVEAATLALLKYLPGQSKKPNEIFREYASGNPMDVGVEFENGNLTGVQLEEVRGSVRLSETGNGRAAIPPVAFDAGEYFSLSGPERTKFIFARAKLGESLTIANLTATVTANIKNIRFEQNTPFSEEMIRKVCDEVAKAEPVMRARAGTELTPQTYLSALYDGVKESLKLANENARRMAQTVQGLTQIKDETTASGDIEQRLAVARTALDTANAEVARLKQVGVQLKADIEEAEATAKTAVEEAMVQKQMADLESTRPAAVQPAGEKPGGRTMATERPSNKVEASAQAAAIDSANATHREKKDAQARVETLEKEIETAGNQSNCPTCGHDIKDRQKKIVADLKKTLKDAKAILKEKTALHAKAVAAEKIAIECCNAATDAIAKWDAAKTALDTENQAALDDWNSRRSAYNNYQAALNLFTSSMHSLKSSLDGNSVAREAAAKLPSLRQKIEQARTDYNTAKDAATSCQTTLDSLDTEFKALLKQRAEASSRASALDEASKKQTEAMVLKETVKLIEALQQEIVKQTVQPILDRCNELCSGILRLPLAMIDGEIGMQDRSGFVTHKAMSDSERMLAYASLSIALASDAPFRFCVIGRFEAFDHENQCKLIERALNLVHDGKLDQCLFVLVGEARFGNQPELIDNKYFSIVEL